MLGLKRWTAGMLAIMLVACGGGGTSPASGSGGSGSGGTGGSGDSAGYSMTLRVQRAGVTTSSITSAETVQAVATVVATDGTPVSGAVVTFSESGVGLLKFAPTAATALTDASGVATVDVAATDATKTGATTVAASAAVLTNTVTASTAIAVTATSAETPAIPAAINFIGSVPADKAIVIKGSGGNGRSESAILTFEVVDANNAPIKGLVIDFTLNSTNGGASLQSATSTSNASGIATATVSSGSSPASVVVTAVVRSSTTVTSQSDTLLVSNNVPVAGGFEIVAAKYNLDGRKTGDSTSITAFVRDANGNPVADGVGISFVTDFGVVGQSTLGGCTTVNGRCSVTFAVQDPRGGGVATVIGTVNVGSSTSLEADLQINMAGADGGSYQVLPKAGNPDPTDLHLTSCKQSFEVLLADASGRSTSVGTVVASPFASTGVTVTVKAGSPVLDQLAAGFPPTTLGLEVDLTSATLASPCKATSAGGVLAAPSSPVFFNLTMTSAGGLVYTQRINVLSYPQ